MFINKAFTTCSSITYYHYQFYVDHVDTKIMTKYTDYRYWEVQIYSGTFQKQTSIFMPSIPKPHVLLIKQYYAPKPLMLVQFTLNLLSKFMYPTKSF